MNRREFLLTSVGATVSICIPWANRPASITYVVFENASLADFGSRIPTLSSIILDISDRIGVESDDIDVSSLSEIVVRHV